MVNPYRFCVNKLSGNKETSAYFLSNFLNKYAYDIESLLPPELRSIRTFDYIKPFFKDAGLYKGVLSDEKRFKLYECILNNSIPRHYNNELYSFIHSIIKDFLNNKITVDEAMELMQQKADLILNE